jgi:hypothetical protein
MKKIKWQIQIAPVILEWYPKLYLCDTRFAKKRSCGLFFLFFSSFGCCILGIWNLWKAFTTRTVEFLWFGACDGVGSCRVG